MVSICNVYKYIYIYCYVVGIDAIAYACTITFQCQSRQYGGCEHPTTISTKTVQALLYLALGYGGYHSPGGDLASQ